MIQAEQLGRLQLSIGKQLVVPCIPPVSDAKNVRGKHHRNRHAGQMVCMPSVKNRERSLSSRHESRFSSNTDRNPNPSQLKSIRPATTAEADSPVRRPPQP